MQYVRSKMNLQSNRFPYQTKNPWPFSSHYGDWTKAVTDLETWLENYVGDCMVQWAWCGGQLLENLILSYFYSAGVDINTFLC